MVSQDSSMVSGVSFNNKAGICVADNGACERVCLRRLFGVSGDGDLIVRGRLFLVIGSVVVV